MKIHLLNLLLIWATCLTAQLPNSDFADYQAARAGLVVVSNSDELLPLQGLDTLRPVLLSVGLTDDTELLNTLNTYLPTATGRLTNTGLQLNRHPLQAGQPNLVILVMNAKSADAEKFPWERLTFVDKRRIVVVFVGRGELTEAVPEGLIPTFIHSESDGAWAQSLMAQLIFGAIGSEQRLFTNLSTWVKAGAGVSVVANRSLAFAPPASQQMDVKLLQDSIARIVQDGLDIAAFPGAQVLVARHGVVVYHQAFGYHTEAAERPVLPTDIYDLASVTKISSALPALMKWHGEASFDVDAPLATYYPPAKKSNKADLTFRTMLSHHARLRPWIPYWQATLRGNGRYPWSKRRDPARINDYRFRRRTLAQDSSANYPLFLGEGLWQHRDYQQQMRKAILKSPLEETTEYRYSGLLFYLLPDIVARESGMDYEQYLQQTFYRPLGATTLGYNPLKRFPLDRIIPTERDSFFRMSLLHGHVHDEGAAMMGGVSANAGLFANATDLAKLMQLYLNEGYYGGQPYISASSVATFTQRYYAAEGNRRGLGFDKPLLTYDAQKSSVAKAASDASFGHAGYTGTFTWMDPENGLLYIFMSNRVYPSRKNRGIYIQNIRPRIHEVLYRSILSN